jgi:hypothetical protein
VQNAAQQLQNAARQAAQQAVQAAHQAAQGQMRVPVQMPNGEIVFTETSVTQVQTAQPKQAKPSQKPQPDVEIQQIPGSGARQRVVRSPFGEVIRPDYE